MNYKELPLNKRINLASQYALLLMADMKLKKEIVAILQKDYALTKKEAYQAFFAMRARYRTEYNSTVLSYLWKGMGVLGMCLLSVMGYYFLEREMGGLGSFFKIAALVIGLGAIAGLIVIGTIIGKKYKDEVLKGYTLTKDKTDEGLLSLAFMGLLLACVCGYCYFLRLNIIDKTSIATVNNCIVTEPVRYASTGGKNRRYYYSFKFKGHGMKLSFFNKYYNFAPNATIPRVDVGDTVSIQVFKDKLDVFNDEYSAGSIDMVNLGFNGKFIIDHDYRNKRLIEQNRRFMYISLAVFAGFILIYLFKQYYYYLVFCEQIEKQGKSL